MARAHGQRPGSEPVEIRSPDFWRPGFWRTKAAGLKPAGQRGPLVILQGAVGPLWRLITKRLQATPKKLFVSETAALGERRSIAVIEFERRRFLVGCSAGSINLLAQLPDAEINCAEATKDSQHHGRKNNGREDAGRADGDSE